MSTLARAEKIGPMILAIDCAANLCSACVYDSEKDRELGRKVLDLGRGHAEHLIAVIVAALGAAGKTYAGLGSIVVSVGPGSFTGLRVGVATARGLSLALKIPAIGVTTLEALATEAWESFPQRPVLVVLDGGRGEIHGALYDEAGKLSSGPAAITLEEAAAMTTMAAKGLILTGSAAMRVAEAAGQSLDVCANAATADIAVYARLGARKAPDGKPKPLYLRGADAKPQAGFILPMAR